MSAVAPAPTIRTALEDAAAALAAAGVATPRADAEWLLAGTLGVGRAHLGLDVDLALSTPVATAFDEAVRRRAAREPLQQILGWEGFRGLRVRVSRDVLVPRPETEMLVEWALELLPPARGRRLRVADVGTGSGCIACALVVSRGDLDVLAVDISPAAASIAAANIRALAPAVRVVVADALGVMADRSLDAVIANPPYLTDAELGDLMPEISGFEPRIALAGGSDGRRILDALVDEAARVLRPRGLVMLETGGPAHVAALTARLRSHRFEGVSARADLAGVTRFVAGCAPPEPAA